ncbi:MAG TPA: DAK2 domain-containing protein [Acidimicrobiia bacterium]|jgi:DAK2 domain fusion protein YloV|nr:DAK2 domain-containing protein [Acidimicrobiia bacterium]
MLLTALSADDLRRAVVRFRDALRAHQEELNRLNVYPVPDGDTGTNMALTLESVCSALNTANSMEEVCHGISRGSLMGARGNSGVIMSQILRGLAEVFREVDEIDGTAFARGLRRGADAAYEAVMRPVEGTILTVVRESAEAVEATGGGSLTDVLDGAFTAACAAVDKTPELLPVLRDAGVVDAGGRGFTLLLAAFLEVVAGRAIPEPEIVATPPSVAAHLAGDDDVSNLRYEVMYLLDADADDATIPGFREAWSAIGDSIVIVGGEGLWNCHIHTNDIGGAIEAGIDAGRPRSVRVTDLFEQVEEERWVREAEVVADLTGSHVGADVATAVVAVGVGDGVRRLLASLGVQHVVAGGQSMNPSTAQILEAVDSCGADTVIVLPNNKNIVPVAKQVDALSDKHVIVVPTTSVPEALAALVEYDPNSTGDQNQNAMDAALQRVRTGEVTQAVRDAALEGEQVHAGDWIALSREGLVAATRSPADAVCKLLGTLVDDDSEIVTVLVGCDAPANETDRIREHIEVEFPHVEVEFHDGGQPLYPYLVGVE